ncbi:MAG: aconitase X catalytic domain-containing protein [Alphaproteobacteria bacterium]
MRLTALERSWLDGAGGPARQRAMDLLVRYGEALGAERLVETRNVAGTWNAGSPGVAPFAEAGGLDAVFSKFNLDADDVVETPPMAVPTCQLIHGIDTRHAHIHGVAERNVEWQRRAERYFGGKGVAMFNTCTPYQVGNVPVKGEHCAWMESSAVVYCNAVLGARTNTEGRESTGAAAITGRIPYWGYHLAENRHATHRIEAEVEIAGMMEWGLFGYHVGAAVEEDIPVLTGRIAQPHMIELKHFGAAAASSGGVEMYHIPGVTPEAPDLAAALGPRRAVPTLRYGAAERAQAHALLNSTASDSAVDLVMLGCPHNAIEQVWTAARLLEGRRIHANTALWIFTPRALRDAADLAGYTATIEAAGGWLMSDTCPAIGRVLPAGCRTVATDSAKQAHYLPAIMNVGCWFGSVEDCIDAALTGRWRGGLR